MSTTTKLSLSVATPAYNKFKRWQNGMYAKSGGSEVFAYESRAVTWLFEQIFSDPVKVMEMRAKELSSEFAHLMKHIRAYQSMTEQERSEAFAEDPSWQLRRKIHIDVSYLNPEKKGSPDPSQEKQVIFINEEP